MKYLKSKETVRLSIRLETKLKDKLDKEAYETKKSLNLIINEIMEGYFNVNQRPFSKL